jgi:hypothetical protein
MNKRRGADWAYFTRVIVAGDGCSKPNYVKESDVLTNMEILQRGFEQPSPATITLVK